MAITQSVTEIRTETPPARFIFQARSIRKHYVLSSVGDVIRSLEGTSLAGVGGLRRRRDYTTSCFQTSSILRRLRSLLCAKICHSSAHNRVGALTF